jgi:RecA-family ATPase
MTDDIGISPEEILEDAGVRQFDPRAAYSFLAWLNRELSSRDFLLGSTFCSTSRWLIFGDTGVGKTIFALCGLAGAMASGQTLFEWLGRRRLRVMYLDGEMPAETFKERMQLTAKLWGVDLEIYGYNRDVLPEGAMPPLNTEEGQKWLWNEIELVQPAVIIFDSIMCLLQGPLTDEETWAPIKPLVRQISARRIGQIWLHHTGHDTSKGYGTKTMQWEMDTVAGLFKVEDAAPTDTVMRLEFQKARLRNPANASEFKAGILRLGESEWTRGDAAAQSDKEMTEQKNMQRAIVQAFSRLTDEVGIKTEGFDGKTVIKVSVEALREELKKRGFLTLDDKGRIDAQSRTLFSRAKRALLREMFIELDGLIWRPAP